MLVSSKKFIRKTNIAVNVQHDQVRLSVGNWYMDLPYEVALKLSQWMRLAGKQAKKNAGDVSRSWSVAGMLTDAQQELKKGAGWY